MHAVRVRAGAVRVRCGCGAHVPAHAVQGLRAHLVDELLISRARVHTTHEDSPTQCLHPAARRTAARRTAAQPAATHGAAAHHAAAHSAAHSAAHAAAHVTAAHAAH
eukprot:scaffold94958_cov45-Phaeocystis_antarctica.AAC.1